MASGKPCRNRGRPNCPDRTGAAIDGALSTIWDCGPPIHCVGIPIGSSRIQPCHMRDPRVVRSRHFHKLQRRHFVVFDIMPFVGTLVALSLLFYRPIGAVEIGLFFTMWLMTGLGLTVGYHRLFTHRAFSTGTAMSCILVI